MLEMNTGRYNCHTQVEDWRPSALLHNIYVLQYLYSQGPDCVRLTVCIPACIMGSRWVEQ
jgi:hypothetical protein